MMAAPGVLLVMIGACCWLLALGSMPGTATNYILAGGFMIVAGCVLIAAARIRDAIFETAELTQLTRHPAAGAP